MVLAAVLLLSSCGKIGQGIIGKVVDGIFGDQVSTVDIKIVAYDRQNPQTYMIKADENGEFQLQLEPGNYRIEFEDNTTNFTYARKIETFEVVQGKAIEMTYKLDPIVKQWIHGIVTDKESKKPIADATISFDDATTKTNKKGEYELKNYRPGLKHLKITAKGYAPISKDYKMSSGESAEDFEMSPADSIEGATVKPLTDLVSCILEVTSGSAPDKDLIYTIITENNFPYAVKVESGTNTNMLVLGKCYKSNGDKFALITEDEFDKNVDQFYTKPKALLDEAYKQFNALKKEMSTDVIKLESANLVSYSFKVKHDGTEYDCKLELYFDGTFRGFMNKITFTAQGKYIDIILKDLNLPKNLLVPPDVK
jgi:hypothetical protein